MEVTPRANPASEQAAGFRKDSHDPFPFCPMTEFSGAVYGVRWNDWLAE